MPGRILFHLPRIVALGGLFALLVSICWIGYMASDDSIYVALADNWISGTEQLPANHWGFRYPIIGALVAATQLFGHSESAVGFVAVAFGATLLLVVYLIVNRFLSPGAALFASALAATTPILVVSSSSVNADIPEALFAIISIGLFVGATQAARPARHLFASGLIAGLAFLTRETASGLVLAYFVLFLAGAFLDRKLYLWGALGFLCVLGAEVAYFMAHGEGPFYRYMTIANSHGTLELSLEDSAGGSGNISTNRVFGPILALLVNQEFGLLYYLVVPASWSLLRSPELTDIQRVFVRVSVTVMLVWILWTSYNGAVPPFPNYYTVATVLAPILIGLSLYFYPNRKVAAIFAGLIVAANLAALSLENTHPRFAARTLVAYLDAVDEPVYTDFRTYNRAEDFLRWSSAETKARLYEGTPPNGALYFYNPDVPMIPYYAERIERETREYPPSQKVREWAPPKRGIGWILTGLGLAEFVPVSIRSRLIFCASPVQSFRVER